MLAKSPAKNVEQYIVPMKNLKNSGEKQKNLGKILNQPKIVTYFLLTFRRFWIHDMFDLLPQFHITYKYPFSRFRNFNHGLQFQIKNLNRKLVNSSHFVDASFMEDN